MQAWEEKYYECEEGREEGRRYGVEEGDKKRLIRQVCKKLSKGKTPEIIADELEEKLHTIEMVCTAALECGKDSSTDTIYDKLTELETSSP